MTSRILLAAAVAAALAGAANAAPKPYQAPRTASGAPDLNGLWNTTSLTQLQRPAAFDALTTTEEKARAYEKAYPAEFVADGDPVGGRDTEWWELGDRLMRIGGQIRTSIITEPPDGKIPYSPAGRKRQAEVQAQSTGFDGPEQRPTPERCLTGVGLGGAAPMLKTNYNSNYLFVQTPDHVAIWIESYGTARIVRLGAKDHLPPSVRPWMGDSIGRWDGETLVVETTNFNPGEAIHFPSMIYISADARVTERFTRIAPAEMLYAFTVVDPQATTRPWGGELIFHTARGPIYEYACHEGNYSLPGVLAGARHEEQLRLQPSAAAP